MLRSSNIIAFATGYFMMVISGALVGWVGGDLGVSLLGVLAVFMAVVKYFDEKEKEKKEDIVALTSFYREKILVVHTKFIRSIDYDKHGIVQGLVQIPLANPSTEFLKQKHSQEALKQNQYLWDGETGHLSLELLNLLEEFAIRVRLLNAQHNEWLSPLRSSYWEMLEQLAVRIVAQRDMLSGNSVYNNALDLYKVWTDKIETITQQDRIKEFTQKFKM